MEARYGGKTRYYRGTITKVHGNGRSYDVFYGDDGVSESNVDAALIRVVEATAGGFAEGQKVEARYGGKSRYYGGKIVKVGEGGKYTVLYDDGETESNVDAALIRTLSVVGSSDSRSHSVPLETSLKVTLTLDP